MLTTGHNARSLIGSLGGARAIAVGMVRGWHTFPPADNETIRQVAWSRGIPVVDMAHLFGGDRELFSDLHYTVGGSQRFGTMLATQLAPLVKGLK